MLTARNIFIVTVFALFVWAAVGGYALADSIYTTTETHSWTGHPGGGGADFDRFNKPGGTLLSVEMDFSYGSQAGFTVTTGAYPVEGVEVYIVFQQTLVNADSFPEPSGGWMTEFNWPWWMMLGAWGGSSAVSVPAYSSLSGVPIGAGYDAEYLLWAGDQTDLSNFTGPGQYNVSFSDASGWGFSEGDLPPEAEINFDYWDGTTTVDVIYTYSIIPEPGTLALIAPAILGLAGIAAARRRVRREA